MRYSNRVSLIALAALALASSGAAAQQRAAQAHTQVHTQTRRHETQAQLKAQAKVTESAARTTALGRVPGGKVQSAELEREDGKLVYSYDIKVAGKPGIEEVLVDALTGGIVKQEHETPEQEKAEKLKEAGERAARRNRKKG